VGSKLFPAGHLKLFKIVGEPGTGKSVVYTRAIMMDTMLSIDRWPEAVDYACHTHNIAPITRKTQHDGSGIPPLVELSNSHSPHGYSLIECDTPQTHYA
jgi:hypothetical protein